MNKEPRSRIFIWACSIYIFAVVGSFIFGLIFKDPDGVSFVPTALLTIPWFFLAMATPHWLFAALTAFYDLPLFLVSALLNLGIAEVLRRLRLQKQMEILPRISPRQTP